MASTYTNIGIEKQATGENANTWGTKTNTNFDIIDERLSEIYEISSTSATQTISAPTDATAGQNTRSATLKYTGAASADMVVTLPTDVKITYNVLNWGTGDTGVGTGYDITFKVGSGTNTATVKNGKSGIIHSDGANRVYLVSNSGSESLVMAPPTGYNNSLLWIMALRMITLKSKSSDGLKYPMAPE